MQYHILHEFRAFTPFKEKSSDLIKDLHKMKLLKNFYVNLNSVLGGVINSVLNNSFITPPGDDVRLTSKFVRSLSL